MNRTILITGGSGKLGKSLLKHFLAKGDRVITNSRSDSSMTEMQRMYAPYKDQFIAFNSDFTNNDSVISLVQRLHDSDIYPDCLVNNARSRGYLQMDKEGKVSRENFAGEFLLDVIIPYELTMAIADHNSSRLRRVVNIGSQYGSVAANPHLYTNPLEQSPLHYSVCKAAVAHLTKELAVRLAGRGIQVNCVAFGGVEGRVDSSFKERYAKLCPMGRMLSDDEIAGPVDMLLTDHFSGMTGHVMAVDGGWGIW